MAREDMLNEFRTLIKKRRTELGYSLHRVGNAVGMTRNTLKQIEDGKIIEPGLFKSIKLMEMLDIDMQTILHHSEDEFSRIHNVIEKTKGLSDADKKSIMALVNKCLNSHHIKISTILLVDDQVVFSAGIKAMLLEKNYSVITAANYDEAISALDKTLPDLALLDINLNERLNGIDVLKTIQTKYPSVYCIMLSAHRDQQMVQESLEFGAFDYLSKEDDMEKIFFVIKRIEEYRELKNEKSS